MLNDWLRNETYMKAIKKKLEGGQFRTVIDIGTGTGLLRYVIFFTNWIFIVIMLRNTFYIIEFRWLIFEISCSSLYVKAAGADYVCACDYSSVMTSIAQQVFRANVPPNSINVVNKLSSDMKIPEDMPYR